MGRLTWFPVCRHHARPSTAPHVAYSSARSWSAWITSAETAEPCRTGGCFGRSSWSTPEPHRLVCGSSVMRKRTPAVECWYQTRTIPSYRYICNTSSTVFSVFCQVKPNAFWCKSQPEICKPVKVLPRYSRRPCNIFMTFSGMQILSVLYDHPVGSDWVQLH